MSLWILGAVLWSQMAFGSQPEASEAMVFVTAESVSSAQRSGSPAFKELLKEYLATDGEAIPLRFSVNPTFADKLGEVDRLIFDGFALLITKVPTETLANARSVFLRDKSLLSRIRTIKKDGLPVILLPIDRGARGFVLPNDNAITKDILKGLEAIVPSSGANRYGSVLGMSPKMTSDVLVHEFSHLGDFRETSDVARIMDKIEKIQSLQGNERAKYFNFVREYLAYRTQLKYLSQLKTQVRDAYGYFDDENPPVKQVPVAEFYSKKVEQIRGGAKYHGWRLSPALKELKSEPAQYCKAIEILRSELEIPELPFLVLLEDGYDQRVCQPTRM